jgi:serine/threonine protein kinase
MVGPDMHVRILDVGLATVLDDDQQTTTRLTGTGTTVGTVAYMAPEQVRGEPDGAEVRYRKYGSNDEWRLLGATPVRNGAIPFGLLEWQLSKPGFTTLQDVGLSAPYLTIANRAPRVPHAYVMEPPDRVPSGMVRASPRGPLLLAIAGVERVPPFELDDFWIDRFEVHVPSLMLNGRYDFFFPVDASQRFMFQLTGVPEANKRWVVYETSHALPRAEAMKETLAWLDKHFGPVALTR